jgi:hypothetical protein
VFSPLSPPASEWRAAFGEVRKFPSRSQGERRHLRLQGAPRLEVRLGSRSSRRSRRHEVSARRDLPRHVGAGCKLPGVRLLNGGAAAEPEPGSAPRCCTRRATGRGSRLDCRHGPSATSVLAGSATRNGHTGRCRTRPAAPSDDAKPCASSRSRASSFSSAGKPSRGDFRRQGLRYALSLMRPAFGLVTMDAEGGG